jgi:hypothetical protein
VFSFEDGLETRVSTRSIDLTFRALGANIIVGVPYHRPTRRRLHRSDRGFSAAIGEETIVAHG